uniref:Complex III subunit 9 n=1 Tax=Octopus bimaculoides TaxID=37653 RepID=A0A0L8IA91_OCTBM
MSLVNQIYNALFRRTSTFALTVICGAFLFERIVDEGGDYVFARMNNGKLWHQIKYKYMETQEDGDDE